MTRFPLMPGLPSLVPVGAAAIGLTLLAVGLLRTGAGAEPNPASDAISSAYSDAGYYLGPLPDQRVRELASRLGPEAFRITQKAGTEPAYCGDLLDNKKDGLYACVVCGLPLFSSDDKFTSGTGWPSFSRAIDPAHVTEKPDHSLGMVRTEIACARCGAHLGHVFDDGPEPTGKRHCLNSASMRFYEDGAELPPESRPARLQTAYFAGGCFWGVEHYFEKGPGVLDAVSGYMQGSVENPSYREVVSKRTGHAETVKVVFDANRISYQRLVEAFFDMHDARQVNRQGPDVGPQYRSGIWYTSQTQRRIAEDYIATLDAAREDDRPIATQVEPAQEFFPAEAYHQDYIARTGRRCAHTDPWK